jgi:rRNA maturation endonuclease Nob1
MQCKCGGSTGDWHTLKDGLTWAKCESCKRVIKRNPHACPDCGDDCSDREFESCCCHITSPHE